MNVGEWLHSRTPRPPRALTLRLDAHLAELDATSVTSVEDTLMVAGERLLAELLRKGGTSRETALDLLAADALVTYMMEAAAENIQTLDARAELVMAHISTIAEAASLDA